ncbi:MAG: hypothetical protein KDK78_00210 [Chlamydiia bacterium]|nr:hypothetical protein [Chlamydiia bacterium]
MIPSKTALNRAWICALVLTALAPALWPSLTTVLVLPCLCASVYRYRLGQCIWFGVGTGLLLDLFSPYGHLGIYSLSHCLAVLVCYRIRWQLFADQMSSLPLLSALAACTQFYSTELLSLILEGSRLSSGIYYLYGTLHSAFLGSLCGAALGVAPFVLLGIQRPIVKRFQRDRPT